MPVIGLLIWYNTWEIVQSLERNITLSNCQNVSISRAHVSIGWGEELHQESIGNIIRVANAESVILAFAPIIADAIWIFLGSSKPVHITELITAKSLGEVRNKRSNQVVGRVGSEDECVSLVEAIERSYINLVSGG